MKYLALCFILIFSTVSTAADGTQAAYHLSLISALFGLLDVVFFVIGLVLLTVLIVGFFNTVTEQQNNNLMQRMDRQPVTWFRFIVGIMVLSGFLFTPMNMATIGGDLVARDAGNSCLVVEVDAAVQQFKSNTPASECFENMMNDLSGSVETSEFNQTKMKVFLGAVQLIAVGFMGFAATMFVMNMAGFKNVALTPGKAIGVMIASTIVFAAPSLIAYVVEMFNGSNRIMGMGE
jgi:uncharacterized membrane protein